MGRNVDMNKEPDGPSWKALFVSIVALGSVVAYSIGLIRGWWS